MVLTITMRPNLIPPMHLSLFIVVSLFPFLFLRVGYSVDKNGLKTDIFLQCLSLPTS